MPNDNLEPVRRYHVLADADALARRAAAEIARIATACIRARGSFHIVLAGGGTPKATYEILGDDDCAFGKWHVWFGDERCLPVGHADRNDSMARVALLSRAAIPAAQVHGIAGEIGPERAARAYASELQHVGEFDLVLLGLGEDGHTASLFPGHDLGASAGAAPAIAVLDAPKAPPGRVSLSAARLSRSRNVIFLVAGSSKRDAMARLQRGEAIPAGAIRPPGGVDFLLTRDAAPPTP